jgi:hypothetical protein
MRVLALACNRALLGGALLVCACGSSDSGSPGGAGGSGGSTADAVAPTFAGARDAVPTPGKEDSRVTVSWDAASDNVTPATRISYRVYLAQTAGGEDYGKPFTTLPAGSTSAVLSGLAAGTSYFVVVRALDEAGNEEQNTVEKSAATSDAKAPRFAGITQAQAMTSRSVLVGWKPAHDNGTPASAIRYRVYAGQSPKGEDFTAPVAESMPGDASILVTQLQPSTSYFFMVHAVDATGNEDDNDSELGAVTPEGIPPVFNGLTARLDATPAGITLYWQPAVDNVTETPNIVYEVYQATTQAMEDYTKPSYVTQPGADSFTVTGLTPAMRYYFVVRARDTAGNLDTNQNEKRAASVAPVDGVAPNFNGVDSVVGSSPTSLLVSWTAATDDGPAQDVVYDVFAFDSSNTVGADYSTPTLTSQPGATSAVIAGLPVGSTRYVVVRARDQANNVIKLTDAKSGTTLAAPTYMPTFSDSTPPVWSSGPAVTQANNGGAVELDVTFPAATDDNPKGTADIRYDVCVDTFEPNCLGSSFLKHLYTVTDFGVDPTQGITLTGLRSRTRYFVYVRAEDRSGNLETGAHGGAATTPTTFSGDVEPILRHKCSSCHDYSSPQLVVSKPSGFEEPDGLCSTKVVLPDGMSTVAVPVLCVVSAGKPELSMLYRKVNPLHLETAPFSASVDNNYTGLQEPRDGAEQITLPLSGSEVGAIRDWITQGAYAQ